jgi:hypothetical protein
VSRPAAPRGTPIPAARRRGHAPDATTEPAPDPAPEAVFDRVTGPYARAAAHAPDEDA